MQCNFYINGTLLQNVGKIRDLGVIIDNKLEYIDHFESTISRAFKMLGFILRSCKGFNIQTLKILYCALVRSILDYASVLWSPYYQVHVDHLEKVQNRFLRSIAYRLGWTFGTYSYKEVLSVLNLTSLATRRTTKKEFDPPSATANLRVSPSSLQEQGQAAGDRSDGGTDLDVRKVMEVRTRSSRHSCILPTKPLPRYEW